MTAESALWEIEDDGELLYATEQTDALMMCFPQFDLVVRLTPETFTEIIWDGCFIQNQGTIVRDNREAINKVIDLWRQAINQIQARIDAVPNQED